MGAKRNFLDTIILMNPSYLMVVEWLLFIVTGVLGWVFCWSKMPFSPVLNVIGGVVFLGALVIHILCGQTHKQAHVQAENITHIVTIGIYAKIRHPLYLSLIFMNIGIGLVAGIIWTLILAGATGVLAVWTSFKEEAFLLGKFPEDYGRYMRNVPWRMIPGMF